MVAGLEDWRVGGVDWKVGGLEVHWQQKRLFLPALQHQVHPPKIFCIDNMNISSQVDFVLDNAFSVFLL